MENKKTFIEKFINKVDLPWGMSKAELEIFQKEVEQLQQENEELKSSQNKVAIEKLKSVRGLSFEHQHNPNYGYADLECEINKLIADLKGEKDE